MGIDFSTKFLDAGSSVLYITDTTLEARGSLIEGFMIGLTHVTWTSSTIPTDCKSFFLKAWELDIEDYLAKRGINLLPAPEGDWEAFLNSKFADVIKDNEDAGAISDFNSIQDFKGY